MNLPMNSQQKGWKIGLRDLVTHSNWELIHWFQAERSREYLEERIYRNNWSD